VCDALILKKKKKEHAKGKNRLKAGCEESAHFHPIPSSADFTALSRNGVTFTRRMLRGGEKERRSRERVEVAKGKEVDPGEF